MAAPRVSPSSPLPRPKSPPDYPDLYGKRRELARVVTLEREIGFLQEELKMVEALQPASSCIKEVADYVIANPEPLIPTKRKVRKSCRFWNWLCGKSCFSVSWICCCSCRCPETPRCCCCCDNCCLPGCCNWSLPKCSWPRCSKCCPKCSCSLSPRCPSCSCCKCSCSCWPSAKCLCPKFPKCPTCTCCNLNTCYSCCLCC